MQVAKRVDALLVYLACIRSGVALLPMNTGYTAAEVAHLVADAEPGLVLRDADLDELVAAASGFATEFENHPSRPDDLAAILYTSGTTGRPKGAMLSHRNLVANCLTLAGLWGFTGDDVLLHALPIFHTHGLFVATNCALIVGAPMVFLAKFEPDAVLRALPRCTVMMGVPTFYTRLLTESRFDATVCASMRLFISGSAPLLASVHDEFRARVGHAILERYGMTETTMLTSNPLDGERRAGTVGMPLPGVDVRVVGDDGATLPVGEVGDIEVRGPNVFAGYWRRPDLAATEFAADGFFRTGDVGRFDADGYLHIVGRSKDLIITGGLNVYPLEVEAVLDALNVDAPHQLPTLDTSRLSAVQRERAVDAFLRHADEGALQRLADFEVGLGPRREQRPRLAPQPTQRRLRRFVLGALVAAATTAISAATTATIIHITSVHWALVFTCSYAAQNTQQSNKRTRDNDDNKDDKDNKHNNDDEDATRTREEDKGQGQ
jgi:acyl-CoA synthetase (AMP-forming)/AMP-acid ligase II